MPGTPEKAFVPFDFVVPTPSCPPTPPSACSSRLFTDTQYLSRRNSRMSGTPLTARSSYDKSRVTPAASSASRGSQTWRAKIGPAPSQPPSRVSVKLPAATPRGTSSVRPSTKQYASNNGGHAPQHQVTPRAAPPPNYEWPVPRHRMAGDFRGGQLKVPTPPSGMRRKSWQAKLHTPKPQTPRPPPRIKNGLYSTHQQAKSLPSLESPRKLPATAAIPSMGPSSFMKWIVDGWDTDKDGWIDVKELASGQVQEGPLHRLAGDFRGGDGAADHDDGYFGARKP